MNNQAIFHAAILNHARDIWLKYGWVSNHTWVAQYALAKVYHCEIGG